MTTFSLVMLGLSVIYHWWLSFMMETKGFQSAFLFKLLPFLLGVGLFVVILFEMGMLVMPTGGG